ncbi:FtsB family cell division protein [Solibacillus sp. FSL H8-0538]|uniref:FtsB family cell division protein n=1 Tax=Solibacillus sp. FSL H8-0538 TaxID=2921400 RepID=UPI0030F5FB86
MAPKNEPNELHNRNVKTLENDYVRSNPMASKKIKKKQAVLRRRRLLVFFIGAACITAFLVSTIMSQNERLAIKEAHKIEVAAELEVVKEKQEMLKLQITKLEDDEYIAKLARKEYFLSEEDEIIFTIPKGNESQSEEEGE